MGKEVFEFKKDLAEMINKFEKKYKVRMRRIDIIMRTAGDSSLDPPDLDLVYSGIEPKPPAAKKKTAKKAARDGRK